jgi:hypothetical protein
MTWRKNPYQREAIGKAARLAAETICDTEARNDYLNWIIKT